MPPPRLAFDIDQLALSDKDGKTALRLARDHGHGEIADTLWRRLNTLVANQTEVIQRLEGGSFTADELARELSRNLPSIPRDAETKRVRLTDQLPRHHYETRSLAWQALGEQQKATADHHKFRRQIEGLEQGLRVPGRRPRRHRRGSADTVADPR